MRDFGLAVRMVVVALLTPLVVFSALFWVLSEVTWWQLRVTVVLAFGVGVCVAARDRIAISSRGSRLSVAAAPELHAIVERLCVVADLAKPTIVLERQSLPNSWVEGTVRGGYRLHLTRGLVDLLEPRELEAVIAHELSHVVNHDAAVMTIVGGPGEALLQGGARLTCQGWPMMFGGLVALVIGWAGTVGTRALSRYREFAADAGAVAMTGNPAALAAALMKISDGLVATPKADLRAAAAHDAFHLLPTAQSQAFGLPATHPPLRARIERLERLERRLQRQ
jgi:heat shock protein HtpX